MSSENDQLVPHSLADFRSETFWAGFFRARDSTAFEWYGGWKDLKQVLLPFLARDNEAQSRSSAILIPGCGNSDLSAELYDQGCTDLVNIDFSRDVIREMMLKNLKQRPKMRWQVMDMLHTKFADGAFTAVVDKGALDAVMSDESAAADAAVQQYLQEMQRVLTPDAGTFLCITLAQAHTLRNLLQAFRSHWQSQVLPIPPSAQTASDELQPVLIMAVRDNKDRRHLPVEHQLKAEGRLPNAVQLQEAIEVITQENAHRLALEQQHAQDLASDRSSNGASPPHSIHDGEAFAKLQPGRRQIVHLHLPPNGQSGSGSKQQGKEQAHEDAPRYTATVIDVQPEIAASSRWECCLFIVPQGRELEWLFADAEGQVSLANQCGAKRVILISFNRSHQYGNMEAVKAEVSAVILPLAPEHARAEPGKIPITTTEQGVGSRHVVARAESPLSGWDAAMPTCMLPAVAELLVASTRQIVIEDIPAEEADVPGIIPHRPGMQLRRMIFTSNSSLIQSEALLIPLPPEEPQAAAGKKPARRSSSSKKGPSAKTRERSTAWIIAHSVLMCKYHFSMAQQIVALLGLSAMQSDGSKASPPAGHCRALVIGLGGGSLPAFLHEAFNVDVTTIELDAVILDMARQFFCFPPQLKVEVMDGLQAVARDAEAQPGSLDLLVVDASSGDTSLAMSCPPPPFVEAHFLQHAQQLLKSEGLLIMNCVSRSAVALSQAIHSVQAHFQHVWVCEMKEDVNKLVIGSQSDLRSRAQADSLATEHHQLVQAPDMPEQQEAV